MEFGTETIAGPDIYSVPFGSNSVAAHTGILLFVDLGVYRKAGIFFGLESFICMKYR